MILFECYFCSQPTSSMRNCLSTSTCDGFAYCDQHNPIKCPTCHHTKDSKYKSGMEKPSMYCISHKVILGILHQCDFRRFNDVEVLSDVKSYCVDVFDLHDLGYHTVSKAVLHYNLGEIEYANYWHKLNNKQL